MHFYGYPWLVYSRPIKLISHCILPIDFVVDDLINEIGLQKGWFDKSKLYVLKYRSYLKYSISEW